MPGICGGFGHRSLQRLHPGADYSGMRKILGTVRQGKRACNSLESGGKNRAGYYSGGNSGAEAPQITSELKEKGLSENEILRHIAVIGSKITAYIVRIRLCSGSLFSFSAWSVFFCSVCRCCAPTQNAKRIFIKFEDGTRC